MAPSWKPSSLPDLTNRAYVVTGGNSGIGKWTVQHLAGHGAKVYLGCRSADKGNQAIADIRINMPDAAIELLLMDLMDLNSVVEAAKNVLRRETSLHGLVNNAGIMATPFLMTKDGYESQWQTNYLSHWVLTYYLLPLLQATSKKSAPGTVRIVNVSSMGHAAAPSDGIHFADTSLKDSFTFRRYGQSKLANIMHSKALEQRYGPNSTSASSDDHTAIWNIAVHPGAVDTALNTKSWGSSFAAILRRFGVYITPEEGSLTRCLQSLGRICGGRTVGVFCAVREEEAA